MTLECFKGGCSGILYTLPPLELVSCFSPDWSGLMGFEEEAPRGKGHFYHIRSRHTWATQLIIVAVDQGHLAEEVLARSLHGEVTPFLDFFDTGDLSLLPHLFIYSVIYLYWNELTAICFMLWVMIQHCLIFFAQTVPVLAIESPFSWLCISCGASQVALVVKNPPADAGDKRDRSSIPGLGRFPGRRAWQSTLVLSPGESHGQRSLVG